MRGILKENYIRYCGLLVRKQNGRSTCNANSKEPGKMPGDWLNKQFLGLCSRGVARENHWTKYKSR